MIIEAKDYLVACENPDIFDLFLHTCQASLLVGGRFGNYIQKEGFYIMRAFGDLETIISRIQNSGLGKVVNKLA